MTLFSTKLLLTITLLTAACLATQEGSDRAGHAPPDLDREDSATDELRPDPDDVESSVLDCAEAPTPEGGRRVKIHGTLDRSCTKYDRFGTLIVPVAEHGRTGWTVRFEDGSIRNVQTTDFTVLTTNYKIALNIGDRCMVECAHADCRCHSGATVTQIYPGEQTADISYLFGPAAAEGPTAERVDASRISPYINLGTEGVLWKKFLHLWKGSDGKDGKNLKEEEFKIKHMDYPLIETESEEAEDLCHDELRSVVIELHNRLDKADDHYDSNSNLKFTKGSVMTDWAVAMALERTRRIFEKTGQMEYHDTYVRKINDFFGCWPDDEVPKVFTMEHLENYARTRLPTRDIRSQCERWSRKMNRDISDFSARFDRLHDTTSSSVPPPLKLEKTLSEQELDALQKELDALQDSVGAGGKTRNKAKGKRRKRSPKNKKATSNGVTSSPLHKKLDTTCSPSSGRGQQGGGRVVSPLNLRQPSVSPDPDTRKVERPLVRQSSFERMRKIWFEGSATSGPAVSSIVPYRTRVYVDGSAAVSGHYFIDPSNMTAPRPTYIRESDNGPIYLILESKRVGKERADVAGEESFVPIPDFKSRWVFKLGHEVIAHSGYSTTTPSDPTKVRQWFTQNGQPDDLNVQPVTKPVTLPSWFAESWVLVQKIRARSGY